MASHRYLMGIVIGLLGVSASLSTAGSQETPLMRMLARIPVSDAIMEYFTYVDYEAVITARPGAEPITSWEQFQDAWGNDAIEGRLAIAAWMGIRSSPWTFGDVDQDRMREVMGFDTFDIRRAVRYGRIPAEVMVLEGDFDPQAIREAMRERNYTETEIDGFPVWCGPVGCENGLRVDIEGRDGANPFGGRIGRQQPVMLADSVLVSSGDMGRVQAQATAINGGVPTVADEPDFAAAAEAITQSGLLIQANFINPAYIPSGAEAASDGLWLTMTKRERIALLAQLERSYIPLPQYNLVVIADTATATEQQALVGLVYDDTSDAEAAVELIVERIETHIPDSRETRTLAEMLAERGVTAIETSIYSSDEERTILVVTFRAPLAPSEITEETDLFDVASSRVYGLLDFNYGYDQLGWLATVLLRP